MRAWMFAGAIALAVGCTKADRKKDDPPVPIPPTPVDPAPKAKARTLVLEDHQSGDAAAHYLAVDLAADPQQAPTLQELGERPALPGPGGRTATITAHDDARWVHAIAGNTLVVAPFTKGKPGLQVALDVEPRALALFGDALYVGSDAAVGWIDLAAPKPSYVRLAHRPGYAYKAYDRFVRDGDRLLAIDDEVVPMYADWFALDAGGRPVRRLGDWSLPGVINGHYDDAALLPIGPGRWTLFLIASYEILSGGGHDLAAIPIANDKLEFEPNLTLQNANGKTPILEEHVSRERGVPTTLLGGAAFSGWTGIAIARDARRVLLAAGPRGVLSVPADFTPATKTATVLELGGDVVDVTELGGFVVALVTAGDHSELVILEAGSKIRARHRLPTRVYDRFVD